MTETSPVPSPTGDRAMFMQWSDAFVTGIDIVDRQHQGLVTMLNQLAELLLDSSEIDPRDADDLIQGLLHYVAEHFATEERLMEQYRIDPRHSQHHIHSHRDFAAKVGFTLEQFGKGQTISGIDLLQFLSNWLVFHILGEDKQLTQAIIAIQAGTPPALAFEQIQGCDAVIPNTANDVLVNAVINLYSQLSEQHQLLIQQNAAIEQARGELDHYRQFLEQRVAEQTESLQKTNLELAQALEQAQVASQAKSRFLGIISHELLTPINVILGFANLLEQAAIPEKHKLQANKISQAGRELNGVLNEVLTYSRLDVGDHDIDRVSFLPGGLLAVAVDRFQTQAQAKDLKIHVEVDPEFPYLLGDEERLRQAVEILLSNAIKYSDHGNITLTANILEKASDSVKAELAICDSGIGIPFERQPALFQQFEQLDSTTTRRHQGIGLGLAICSRLVKLLGGELSFVSQPNQGSTFRIQLWLPIDSTKQSLAQQPVLGHDTSVSDVQAKQLKTLVQLLSDGDLEARNVFVQLVPVLQQSLGEETFSQLWKQIHDYQFDKVLAILRNNALLLHLQ